MKQLIRRLLLNIMIWSGHMLFDYVDVTVARDGESIVSVKFGYEP